MPRSTSAKTPKAIVDDVLGPSMTREIWSANFDKALPISVQDYDLSAVLPAVFYMFRFAQRRGKGRFLEVFGGEQGTLQERRRAATIKKIAQKLAESEKFQGFSGEVEQAILGDLLLCFCLENIKHSLGRDKQVQRVAPAHYMAGWIDLPQKVADLRYVPETLVAMLANQDGESVTRSPEEERTWFAVGRGFRDNVLLHAFSQGMSIKGELGSRTSDKFDEHAGVGLDQLLMIRLAQQLGAAPDKLRGKEGALISNQRPIAERTAEHFSEDIRLFVRAYASEIPRYSFVELLESCISVSLAALLTSVVDLLLGWSETGKLVPKQDQWSIPILVDCSNGTNRHLRGAAEQSMDDFLRRTERFPVIFMALRILDHEAKRDRKIRKIKIGTRPYATEWINLLGELLHERRKEGRDILDHLDRMSMELADRLESDDYQDIVELLRNDDAEPNPVWRLSEALTALQGRNKTHARFLRMLDSSLMIGRPNAVASKRKVRRSSAGVSRMRDARSLVFSDSVLDYLVHRHVLKTGKKGRVWTRPVALNEFLKILRERYGLYVDKSPKGMEISNELLQENRAVLERRLRDLGLLIGVNDAESMKCLRSRF